MSRIGKAPIALPDGVEVQLDGARVAVKGPKGELGHDLPDGIQVSVEEGRLSVTRATDRKEHRGLHGLTRAVISNMVVGVSQGYRRVLEIVGVGYKAEMAGDRIVLTVGFSHPIVMIPPEGITFAVEKPTVFSVEGCDKQLVGQCAAILRGFRKPEPYKGKGIRYEGEHIRRKAGKTAT